MGREDALLVYVSRRFVLIAAVAAACSVPTISERPAATGAHRAPDRLALPSIHGAPIAVIATTERGDAAVTVDDIASARLWPTLDGTTEPVELDLGPARALALAHGDDGELVIGVIDTAERASIVRVTTGGAIRGRVSLPGELAVKQLVAIDRGMLAVRADQTIERYDARGNLRGRLVTDPGEQLGALAVRRNGAAVLVGKRATTDVRFIVLGDGLTDDGLAWGTRRAFERAVGLSALALSPDHRKLAVVELRVGAMEVVDVATMRRVGDEISVNAPIAAGFVDNDNLAVIGDLVLRWWPSPPEREQLDAITGGAVADHVAIGGATTALELQTRERKQFLGWSATAAGTLSAVGSDRFAIGGTDGVIRIVDHQLAPMRDIDLSKKLTSPNPIWIDDTHALVPWRHSGDDEALLVDLVHPDQPVSLGSFPYLFELDYEPHTHVIGAVSAGDLYRWSIDPATYATTPLPTLHGAIQHAELLDPARAGGRSAIGFSGIWDLNFNQVEWNGSATDAHAIGSQPAALIGVAADGTIYTQADGHLASLRDGTITQLVAMPEVARAALSRDGALIAAIDSTTVRAFATAGRASWSHEIWKPETVVISNDGSHVAVTSRGGVVVFDAATGERTASVCAFGFGVHEINGTPVASDEPTVCED